MNLIADLVFKNGQVITVNPKDEVCTAAAVKGSRILCTGSDADVEGLIGAGTRVVDLAGRSLIPGFIDAHAHYFITGTQQLEINCEGLTSIEQIKAKVKEAAQKTPKGDWIRGCRYNETMLKDGRHLNRWDLDEAAPDHPVAFYRYCYHTSVVNSKALAIMELADNTADEPGGEFLRENGKINGVLRESSHFSRCKYYVYQPHELERAFRLADQYLAKLGITSVHDAGGSGADQLKVLIDMDKAKKLQTRIYMSTFGLNSSLQLLNDLLPTGVHTGFGSEFLRIGPAKVMLDGSSVAPSASVRRPYNHKDDKGLLSMNQQELDEIFGAAHAAGFQCTAHAVGDNAVEMVISALEKAQEKCPRPDARHRIEHCGIVDDDLLARMKKLGMVPIPQALFIYEQGENYLQFYGEDRVSMMMALRSMLDIGLKPAMSTDCPVYYSHPMYNMYAACTRKSKTGSEICPQQTVTPLEALRMYTDYCAYAAFMEDILGTLEPGKLADMVVLSKPILSIDPETYRDVDVDMTVSNGKVVFEKSE